MTLAPGLPTIRPFSAGARRCSPSRANSATRSYIDPFTPAEIQRLVAEFGSPLLIIDCQRVREQYRKLHKALPGVDLHYALKPLPHAAVVETIVELGGWLDLATTGEAQLVAQLGIDPARCIHTHPIKRDKDIRNALHFGVKIFVADNPDEVRKFEPYATKASCCCASRSAAPAPSVTCRGSSGAIRKTCWRSRGWRQSSASPCAACRSTWARRRRTPASTSRRSRPAQAHRRRAQGKARHLDTLDIGGGFPSTTRQQVPTSAVSARHPRGAGETTGACGSSRSRAVHLGPAAIGVPR